MAELVNSLDRTNYFHLFSAIEDFLEAKNETSPEIWSVSIACQEWSFVERIRPPSANCTVDNE